MLGSASLKPRAIRAPRVRLGAIAALALAAGFAVWLVTRPGAGPVARRATPAVLPAAHGGPRAVSESDLLALASSLGHPLYWAGPVAGMQYELTRTGDRTFVRYLIPGTRVGDPRGHLTIGTYPVAHAWSNIRASARRPGAVALHLAGGTIAVYNRDRPTNVYLAPPGPAVQIEIYDPDPAVARRLALSGDVRPIGTSAVSAPALRAVGRRTPLYWAGPRAGMQYELTEAAGRRIFLRYLPAGIPVGDRSARLTIGTYPVADAFGQVQAAARRPGAVVHRLSGGMIAVYNRSRPTNVYLAGPGWPVQVEVYDPDARTARRLVLEKRVAPVE